MTKNSTEAKSATEAGAIPKMRLRHLAMVSLYPERLAEFYKDVFGMKELHRVDEKRNVFLTDGYITLAILYNRAAGKPSGLNHIGFHIKDRAKIESKLAKYDIPMPAKRPDDRPYSEARLTDPDGNNIDLSTHGYDVVETNLDRE